MGREIRRVPQGWEHPKNYQGHYQPMFDESFDDRLERWLNDFAAFKANTSGQRDTIRDHYASKGVSQGQFDANLAYYYSNYAGGPPDYTSYRPGWAEEPTCYQMYETVTEGTPVSPVFETLNELEAWLVQQGHSPESAHAFCNGGWAPSMLIVPGKGIFQGIDALAAIPKRAT